MYKRLLAYISGLYKNPVLRRTLSHLFVLTVLAGAFFYVTFNNDTTIARTSTLVVPSQYSALKPLKAVDLEQMLSSQNGEIEGLVFIKGTKSIVVFGRGFDNDNVVAQADTDVMQNLAKAAKIPVTSEDATVLHEIPSIAVTVWWFLACSLFVWFAIFLFQSRKAENTSSRFVVGWNAYYSALQAVITRTTLRRSRFYGIASAAMILLLAALCLTQAMNDHNKVILPSDFAAATRSEPYQIERHLQKHADEFNRVAFAPSKNAAYVVLNTTLASDDDSFLDPVSLPDPDTLSAAPATGKKPPVVHRSGKNSIGRTVIYPSTSSGELAYRHFVESVRAHGIDNKEVDRAVATGFFETITPVGQFVLSLIGILALVCGGLAVNSMLDKDKDENGDKRLVIAGPGTTSGAGAGNTTPESRKTFADVAGCDEAIDACKLVVKKLRYPLIYKVFGAPVPKGIIFYGAPGCGKTLLARAMAGETGGGFIACSGSQFVKMYVGVGASGVRDKFAEARALAVKTGKPTFLFIDEFDALGKKRGQGDGGGDKEYEQTLNELLVQMDGFANDGKVIVIAATNRLDVLDEAVLRAGRFDIKIEIKKPDRKGRSEIFMVYLRKRMMQIAGLPEMTAADVTAKILSDCALRSRDFSGADIELTVKEAATIAAERNYDELKDCSEEEMKERAILLDTDLQAAIDLVSYGRTLKSRVRSAAERWATAVHEIGHASIPTIKGGDPVSRITIVMTDKSLGLMESGSEEDRYGWDRTEFIMKIKTMLAGRAAEERIANSCSTGASNDFERASMLARQMVGTYGMSKEFGVRTIPLDRNALPVGQIGNNLMELFTDAWSNIITECNAEVLELIDENSDRIKRAARVLFEDEVLSGDRFREVWAAESTEPFVSPLDAPVLPTVVDAVAAKTE